MNVFDYMKLFYTIYCYIIYNLYKYYQMKYFFYHDTENLSPALLFSTGIFVGLYLYIRYENISTRNSMDTDWKNLKCLQRVALVPFGRLVCCDHLDCTLVHVDWKTRKFQRFVHISHSDTAIAYWSFLAPSMVARNLRVVICSIARSLSGPVVFLCQSDRVIEWADRTLVIGNKHAEQVRYNVPRACSTQP